MRGSRVKSLRRWFVSLYGRAPFPSVWIHNSDGLQDLPGYSGYTKSEWRIVKKWYKQGVRDGVSAPWRWAGK